ncbi:MAG: hypothetical protein ABSE49_07035 [Polyangiaceae bacterium]|jgi:hypothetical protein
MTQATVRPARVRARALAFVVAGLAGVTLAYACAQARRTNGEECLKSEDCLSGVCVQLVCGNNGPLTNEMANNTEAGESDSGSEASTDGASAADTFTAPETGSSSGSEAGEASSD